VALAAVLPLLSTLNSYFIADDFGLIQLFSAKPPLHFLTLFTSSWVEGIYGANADELRPLVGLSYQIDSLWGPANPFGYHVGSIALHTANALLVLVLAHRLVGLSWLASTYAGAAFAVLPVHAEVGAWISGRADSIPALFYLGTLLAFGLWRKRAERKVATSGPVVRPGRTDGTGRDILLFLTAIGLFIAALFSKQSGITMAATLVAYDVLIERRLPWSPWRTSLAYVPFLALTTGYLVLRYLLFGNAVREGQIVGETFVAFALTQATNLQMVATGSHVLRMDGPWPALALIGLGVASVAVLLALPSIVRGSTHPWLGAALFFGPVWWIITVTPLAVTYLSSRHLYLTAVGFAILLGIALAAFFAAPSRAFRWGGAAAGVALLGIYTVTLHESVGEWNRSAERSYRMTQDLWRESAALPPGSLVVFNAPASNAPIFKWRDAPVLGFPEDRPAGAPNPPTWTFIWAWAAPFVYGPPFAPFDLSSRVLLVEPPGVFCCPADQWHRRVYDTISAWDTNPDRPPVAVLSWDDSGGMSRKADTPALREALVRVLDATDPDETWLRLAEVFDTLP
jgi:hypothetical protein